MPRTLRVRLNSSPAEESTENRVLFDGASLALEAFGAGQSKAKVGSPVSAKITLEATLMDAARAPDTKETLVLGTFTGEVELGDSGAPRFRGTLDDAGEARGIEPDPGADDGGESAEDEKNGKSRRVLLFGFDSGDFEDAPTKPGELIVKIDTLQFRFMEVRAKLELDGAVEAEFDVNDVLDVAITASNPPPVPVPFKVQVTDELGEPVPGATVTVLFGATTLEGQNEGVADGDGLIELKPQAGSESCSIAWATSVGRVEREIFVRLGSGRTASERRLHNMGYIEKTVDENVRAFQRTFQLEETGRLADIEGALRDWHDDGVVPESGEAKPVGKEPIVFNGPRSGEDNSDKPVAMA